MQSLHPLHFFSRTTMDIISSSSILYPAGKKQAVQLKLAFITGGDRSDLIIAALNENISCLILTGFIQPDVSIIAEANAKKIPILLSPSDTFTTMRNLNRLLPGLQEDEIAKVLELMDKTMKWDLLL